MIKKILLTGFIAGTMDALGATTHFLIAGGKNLIKIWNFVGSGVFGTDSLTGGLPYAFIGLFLHYIIATIWTLIFFKMYPYVSSITKNWVVLGVAYALLVWVGMNQIVVPLSNTPPPASPMSFSKFATSATVLIICIGLPISFMAKKYLGRKEAVI